MSPKNRAAALVMALGVAAGVSACSEEEPEICADVEALRVDLDDLRAIEIQPGSLAELSSTLDGVKADVDALVGSAAAEFETEVDAVQSATQALTSSVASAVQSPSASAVTQVSADFGAFTTSVEDLREAVADTC